MLHINISDDGSGINLDKLKAKAGEKAQGLDEKTALQLIFEDVLSSSDTITHRVGRGVGMGAVKGTVEELGGSIEVSSTLGEGTQFLIKLPLGKENVKETLQVIAL